MIVKSKPVNAKVNLSRQNGAIDTTGLKNEASHGVNIVILDNLCVRSRAPLALN
jgi:hypothetical protein